MISLLALKSALIHAKPALLVVVASHVYMDGRLMGINAFLMLPLAMQASVATIVLTVIT
jgi:hypothetical protein